MLNNIKLIFFKEMKDVIRDKRSLMAVFAVSIFFPIMMMGGLILSTVMKNKASEKEYHIVGAENAPQLVSFLIDNGIKISEEAGEDEIYLIIPEDFNEKISAGFLPTLTIRSDFSLENRAISRLERTVEAYGEEIATGRLVTRGVSPIILKPFIVDTQDTSDQSSLALLAPLFVYMFFMVPVYALLPASIDSTAGERERNSLLPYLLQPFPIICLPIAKLMMMVMTGLTSLMIAVTVAFTAFSNIKFDGVNLGFDMGFSSGVSFVLMLIPLIFLFSSLMLAFASFAKSFKEGQTYVGVFSILPVVVFGFGFLLDDAIKPIIPVWADVKVLSAVLSGETIVWGPWLLNVLGYAIVVVLLMFWMKFSMQRNAISD